MLSGRILAARRSLGFDNKDSGMHFFDDIKCLCDSSFVPKIDDSQCGLSLGIRTSVAG